VWACFCEFVLFVGVQPQVVVREPAGVVELAAGLAANQTRLLLFQLGHIHSMACVAQIMSMLRVACVDLACGSCSCSVRYWFCVAHRMALAS
jgi:hypothetical protein